MGEGEVMAPKRVVTLYFYEGSPLFLWRVPDAGPTGGESVRR